MSEEKAEIKPDVLLSYKINNQIFTEYVPTNESLIPIKIYSWWKIKYMNGMLSLNKPLYYWHYRWLFPYMERKREDLQFIIHCFRDHDAEPKDKKENKYFIKIYNMYQREITNILVDILQFENVGGKITDHYIEAYRRRWLKRKNVDPEFKLLYHGIDNYFEHYNMIDVIEKKLKRYSNRLNYEVKYIEKLNREFNKKSKTKKSMTKK